MGKKGKKKPQADKPTTSAQEGQQPSRETSQPPVDQSKKAQKDEQVPPSQGTQPGPSKQTSGPEGDLGKQGKKKGKKGPEQPASAASQQQKGSKLPQTQDQPAQQPPQQLPQQQQQHGRPQQQRSAWGAQQATPAGGPALPPQARGTQPSSAEPPGFMTGPRPQPPGQGFQSPPPGQHPGQGFQGPPQSLQAGQQPGRGSRGPPPGQHPGQRFQSPPPGQQPGPGFQGPPQSLQAGQQPGYGSRGPPPGQHPGQRFQSPPPGQHPGPGFQGPPQSLQAGQQPGYGSRGPPPGQHPGQRFQGPPAGQHPGQGFQGPPQSSQAGQQPGRGSREALPAASPQAVQPSQQTSKPTQSQLAGDQPSVKGGKKGKQQSTQGTTQSSVAGITAGMEDVKITKQDAGDAGYVSKTKRPPGKKGRIIKVESNHLQLNLGSLKTAYHYDVSIDPDKPKKYMRTVIDAFRRKLFPNRWPAFDGKKNLYTSTPLSPNLTDVFGDEVSLNDDDGREKKYKVEVKFANKVDLTPLHNLLNSPTTPQEALQVVDIVLRMAPVVSCFPVGRSFFLKPDSIIDLGQGMEMYHGFYQSAIRGWKPLLNVDVAHKAFPKNIMVIDALVELLSTGRDQVSGASLKSLNPYQEQTLQSFIKTLRIIYEITGLPSTRKGYRVNGVGEPAATKKFTHDNRQMTIVEYFQKYKNYKIKYPFLPTLWVGNPNREDKILLPLELCQICEGQALNRKMTEMQTSKMIRQAATDTATRKNKIMQGINRAQYNTNNCVREFGFSVGNEFQKLDARVLTPPEIQYQRSVARVSKGVWRNDLFLTPVTIKRWTIVSCCRYPPRPDEYKRMIDMFERSGRDCGMTFASKAEEPFATIGGRQSYADCEQYFKSQKGKFDVIFVVVPESGPQYSFVKKAAEIAVGCLTQCIKSNTVARKMNQQTAVNILLKVNSKLNGINHTFSKNCKPSIMLRPVMIMGADVTHPGPDARDIPSVAAVTASHDPKAFQYNICWRLQNPKMEIIEDLEAITVEHLKFFYQKTKVKPESIIFFRDGVSEGQFDEVKRAEIRAIRAACKRLQAEGFEPKITFLVVQKRHHTRLFPMNPRDSEDRNCNVPAGTCVDTDITHPFLQDFYLVSHASIQGVAKPTKYCTLWDDNNMDNDQVEELTYYLCHMFSRCNRSVSYPAPTYYAHLAAARAKVYIENDRLNMSQLQREFDRLQIKDEIRKGLPMFFV